MAQSEPCLGQDGRSVGDFGARAICGPGPRRTRSCLADFAPAEGRSRERIGSLGALVWNWQVASDIGGYLWGLVETLVWPGFLVYTPFSLAG